MNNPGVNFFYVEGRQTSAMAWHQQQLENAGFVKPDTIAVHGVYSMQEALDLTKARLSNLFYMSTSQGYRD